MQGQDKPLWTFLAKVRRRWVTLAVLRGSARVFGSVGAIVLVAVMVDHFWLPTGLSLIGLALTVSVVAIGQALLVLWPLRKIPSSRQIARFIEEQVPEFEDRLASAAELGSRTVRSAVQSMVITDATNQVQTVQLDRVVSSTKIRQAIGFSVAGLIVLVTALGLALAPAQRAVEAASLYAFPGTVHISVSPGDVRVMAGEPLKVRAQVEGITDAPRLIHPVLQVESGDEWQDIEMRADDGSFQYEFISVSESFRYRVIAASARSDEYNVMALMEPHVDRIDVEYDYPIFTRLERRIEIDGGDVYAPVGTAVTFTVYANKPIKDGAMVLSDGSLIPLALRDDTTLTGSFEVSVDDAYRVTLSDNQGLSNLSDGQYFIRAIDDLPPVVRILRPDGDRSVTPLEEVTIEARADDDYGLERFEIVYAVRGDEERAVLFPGSTDLTTRVGVHTLYIEDLDVVPGDFVTYYARALDVNRAKASTEARSDIYFLDVTPFEQEFIEAQSQSQGSDGGTGLADLTAAQRAIVVATWKLDRQVEDFSVENEVRTVARAQGELKVRAEQALEEFDPGRRQGEAVSGGTRDGAPLNLAVRAMGFAKIALENIETDEAIPHEMAALNHLLRAQAEIRQREVSRRQAAVGGGSGRPGQDLSALFDQELRRQQQTNYETRSSAVQSDKPESEALDQVRELAGRQADLNRRKQALGRQGPELDSREFQEQLERLTREQTELRDEAERLSRMLDQLGEAIQQTSGGQASSQAARSTRLDGERMREVSEAMRAAAGDLRREDLSGASERGRQALGRLRALEQELRYLNPEERQRAVAEIQSEARDLADAQTLIAREVDQLEVGQASHDTRSRLAEEQAQMANRVDNLHEATGALARRLDNDLEGRGTLEEVADMFEGERLAPRLRESADTLRSAFGMSDGISEDERRSLTESEDALRDSLVQVAERLELVPGGLSDEARRLSEELDQTRALRERLGELERQIEALAGLGEVGELASSPINVKPNVEDESDGLARLGEAYERELRRAVDLLGELRRENPSLASRVNGLSGQYARSAPGTEGFKQDFTRWDELRQDVAEALERLEVGQSGLLSAEELRGRLSSGADESVPETYRALVEAYYEALAVAERRR